MNIYEKMVWKFFRKTVKRIIKQQGTINEHFEFQQKHLRNTTCLINRAELLKKIPSNSVCLELGVDRGFFSEEILSIINPSKLHLVDLWLNDSSRYGLKQESETIDRLKEFANKITIHKGYSTKLVNGFEDNSFDFIYIDTDHSYRTTLDELELYSKKLKPDGILAGHDFLHFSKGNLNKFGVFEAVVQFCNTHNFELAYITLENLENPSFALKKMND